MDIFDGTDEVEYLGIILSHAVDIQDDIMVANIVKLPNVIDIYLHPPNAHGTTHILYNYLYDRADRDIKKIFRDSVTYLTTKESNSILEKCYKHDGPLLKHVLASLPLTKWHRDFNFKLLKIDCTDYSFWRLYRHIEEFNDIPYLIDALSYDINTFMGLICVLINKGSEHFKYAMDILVSKHRVYFDANIDDIMKTLMEKSKYLDSFRTLLRVFSENNLIDTFFAKQLQYVVDTRDKKMITTCVEYGANLSNVVLNPVATGILDNQVLTKRTQH